MRKSAQRGLSPRRQLLVKVKVICELFTLLDRTKVIYVMYSMVVSVHKCTYTHFEPNHNVFPNLSSRLFSSFLAKI